MFFNRASGGTTRDKKTAKSLKFEGPYLGWVDATAGQKNGSAAMLRNMFPTRRGAAVRGGMITHATVGDATKEVVYNVGYEAGAEHLFAFTSSAIFDVTKPLDPVTPQTPVHSGLSGPSWSSASLTTPGGTFLVCVNGVDEMRQFDGSSWKVINGASTPAITGVSTRLLTQVWKFKNRLFFIAGKSAWYLPVLSIGGAAEELPLGGIFNRSGELLFGATWSLDSGAGLDDVCIFVTVDGEVAVYQGTDPSSASDWALTGVYQISSPLDKEGFFKAGGDLGILTRDGIVPISQAIQTDRIGLAGKAITAPISDVWRATMENRDGIAQRLSLALWPEKNMLVIGLQQIDGTESRTLIANAQTGAWAEFTGWIAHSLCVFKGRLFSGTMDGRVMELDVTGQDDGAAYRAIYVPNFSEMNSPAEKEALHCRVTARTDEPYAVELFANADHMITPPIPDHQKIGRTKSAWDSGLWDEKEVWNGGEDAKMAISAWQATPAVGYALAPGFSYLSNDVARPDFELTGLHFQYSVGEVMG